MASSAVWAEAPTLDIESFLRTCGTPTEMKIEPKDPMRVPTKPIEPLIFPSSLTSLSLHFQDAFDLLIKGFKLPAMLPELRTLKVGGKMNDKTPFNLEDFKLPPKLESLTLPINHASHYRIRPEWVSALPRTLLELDIGGEWGHASDAKVSIINEGTVYNWPPELHTFRLDSYYGVVSFVAEQLPRTVTKLDLSETYYFTTTYPQLEEKIVFPWRQFFPRLEHFRLPPLSSLHKVNFGPVFLRSILLDGALDTKEVNNFIASGPWDVESLRHFQTPEGIAKEPYPSYKFLGLSPSSISSFGTYPDDVFVNEMLALAPHFEHTNFGQMPIKPDLVPLMKATPEITIWTNMSAPNLITLPPAVKKVTFGTAHLSNLGTHVLDVTMSTFVGSGEKGALEPQDVLPSSLTRLLTREPPPAPMFDILPVSLTSLYLPIRTPQNWASIVEKLVNLRELTVIIRNTWTWEGEPPLAKIASNLEELTLGPSEGWKKYPTTRPKLHEFFTVPGLFPASLKKLNLKHGLVASWHATVLAVIPRTLTALDIERVAWESTEVTPLTPYPEADGKTAEDLIKSLAQNMLSLRLGGLSGGPKSQSASVLKYVPRTLTELDISNNMITEGISKSEFAAMLPPHILKGSIEVKISLPIELE